MIESDYTSFTNVVYSNAFTESDGSNYTDVSS